MVGSVRHYYSLLPIWQYSPRPMSQNFRVAMGDKMKVIFLAHPQNRFEEFGLQFCIDQYNHVKADLEEIS